MATRISNKGKKCPRQSLRPSPETPPSESCCCMRPLAEIYSKVIRHASCFICQRHGVWAVDLNGEDIIESGWLWKKSKVVGTWRLRLFSPTEGTGELAHGHRLCQGCMSLACDDVAPRDVPSRGEFSDIDSVVSTTAPSSVASSSSPTFAMYVHGTTGDHVTSNCLQFADLWLIPLASNRAHATTSCELCHRLRGRQDLCETRPCGHIYHVDCLYRWVRQSIVHDYCPLCRTPFCGPPMHDDDEHAYTEACPSSIMTFSYRRPVRLNSYATEAFYSLPSSPVQRFPPLELPKKASPPVQAPESLPQPMPMDRLRWRS
ncbi:hypothetical protein FOL47_000048 [Perkinsus chesapeaki]|uniref:RING-type domain-containing protein n=1 Tax=Perkinsus chesapeaki TaxID=330153 RepID=A0A7J6N320_PERCH|nr:hypothetical protein FOL47_000048 [Perkinsus chesapeaki]